MVVRSNFTLIFIFIDFLIQFNNYFRLNNHNKWLKYALFSFIIVFVWAIYLRSNTKNKCFCFVFFFWISCEHLSAWKINEKKTLNVYLLFWCSILTTLLSETDEDCCWSGGRDGASSCGIRSDGVWCHKDAAMPGKCGKDALLVPGNRECGG